MKPTTPPDASPELHERAEASPSSTRRRVLAAAGFGALALGTVGVFLPLLPTTPFVLLAAYCFARSSPRFYQMLLRHRQFGPIIRDWQDHRCIALRTKVVAEGSGHRTGNLYVSTLQAMLRWVANRD